MYNDKLDQNIIIVILKLSTLVTINFINYQLLIQSKSKSIQSFKSIQSKFKSKFIKFVDVKKIYIFENNDNANNNNDDESIFHNDEKEHFITFIKTFFVFNKSINTNIFVVSFTFDASIFNNEVFQQHFIAFIKTFFVVNESINTNIFVISTFVFHKINDEIISIDDINDHFAINFDQFALFSIFENARDSIDDINDYFTINFNQFALFSIFENVNESISFFKNVITFNDNTSHEKSDIVSKNIVQKNFVSKSKIVKFRFFKNLIFNINDAFVNFDFHIDFSINIDFCTFVVSKNVAINHFYDINFQRSFFDSFKIIDSFYQSSSYLNLFLKKTIIIEKHDVLNFFLNDSISKFFTNLQNVTQITFHVMKNRKLYRFSSLHDFEKRESQFFTNFFNQLVDFDFFDLNFFNVD